MAGTLMMLHIQEMLFVLLCLLWQCSFTHVLFKIACPSQGSYRYQPFWDRSSFKSQPFWGRWSFRFRLFQGSMSSFLFRIALLDWINSCSQLIRRSHRSLILQKCHRCYVLLHHSSSMEIRLSKTWSLEYWIWPPGLPHSTTGQNQSFEPYAKILGSATIQPITKKSLLPESCFMYVHSFEMIYFLTIRQQRQEYGSDDDYVSKIQYDKLKWIFEADEPSRSSLMKFEHEYLEKLCVEYKISPFDSSQPGITSLTKDVMVQRILIWVSKDHSYAMSKLWL